MQDVDSFRVVEGTKEKNFVEGINLAMKIITSYSMQKKWLKDTYALPKFKTHAFCHLLYSLISTT